MPISASIAQCTHIKLSGYRCGSPALAGQQLCYYHARLRRSTKARLDAAIPPLLLMEDAESIQGALMQITDMLLYDQIQEKKAGLILRAIGLALRNVKNLQHDAPAGTPSGFDHRMVTEPPAGDPAAAGEEKKDGAQDKEAQPETGDGSAISSKGLPESILPEADKRPFRRYCEAGVHCGWLESEEVYSTQLGRMDRALSAVESTIKTAAMAGMPASSLLPPSTRLPNGTSTPSSLMPEALPCTAERSPAPADANARPEPHFIAPIQQSFGGIREPAEPPPMTPLELAETINSIRERASEDWRKTHPEG
jgi:hypothetical protein